MGRGQNVFPVIIIFVQAPLTNTLNSTQPLAEHARHNSRRTARTSSAAPRWKKARTGIGVRPNLPTYLPKLERAFHRDQERRAMSARSS